MWSPPPTRGTPPRLPRPPGGSSGNATGGGGDTRVRHWYYDDPGLDHLGCDWHSSVEDHRIVSGLLDEFMAGLPLRWWAGSGLASVRSGRQRLPGRQRVEEAGVVEFRDGGQQVGVAEQGGRPAIVLVRGEEAAEGGR